MDLKLYGICFKLRGGPDFLEYVQTNTPVPVDLMMQMMQEMESVSAEELRFAAIMETDWKKGFAERVPLLMQIDKTGGYEINCTVPDELLAVTRILTGMANEKIVEEYTAHHLKTVCGVEASIVSVDAEPEAQMPKMEMGTENAGFDLSDLDAEPELAPFEPLDAYEDLGDEGEPVKAEVPAPVSKPEEEEGFDKDDLFEEPDALMEMPEGEAVEGMDEVPGDASYPDLEDEIPDEDFEDEIPDEAFEDEIPDEDPEDEGFEEELEEKSKEKPEAGMESRGRAIARVYAEMVTNIRERGLDEKLDLRIGQ